MDESILCLLRLALFSSLVISTMKLTMLNVSAPHKEITCNLFSFLYLYILLPSIVILCYMLEVFAAHYYYIIFIISLDWNYSLFFTSLLINCICELYLVPFFASFWFDFISSIKFFLLQLFHKLNSLPIKFAMFI